MTARRKYDDDVTVLSSPDVYYGMTAKLPAHQSTAHFVRNPTNATQFKESALQKMTIPGPKAQRRDMFDVNTKMPTSEKCPASRIGPMHHTLPGKPERTLCEQVASTPVLVENVFVSLFRDAA